MDFERYTERSRGFVQSAQSLALRSNHQRFTPEHLLKVLLEDREGLASNLIRAAGGDPARALAQVERDPASFRRWKAAAPARSTSRRRRRASSPAPRRSPRSPATAT